MKKFFIMCLVFVSMVCSCNTNGTTKVEETSDSTKVDTCEVYPHFFITSNGPMVIYY